MNKQDSLHFLWYKCHKHSRKGSTLYNASFIVLIHEWQSFLPSKIKSNIIFKQTISATFHTPYTALFGKFRGQKGPFLSALKKSLYNHGVEIAIKNQSLQHYRSGFFCHLRYPNFNFYPRN